MNGIKVPTEQLGIQFSPSGNQKTVKLYSYVFTLCERGGSEVTAIRVDGYKNKEEAGEDIRAKFPEWNIKTISKLYEDDFKEGES